MKLEYSINDYVKNLKKGKSYFYTFINKDNLAAGILLLRPKEKDTQTPHESDEIYYIIRGDGFLNINGKDHLVSDGMAFFVEKKIEHKFHGNKKELVALYFFGGPDS